MDEHVSIVVWPKGLFWADGRPSELKSERQALLSRNVLLSYYRSERINTFWITCCACIRLAIHYSEAGIGWEISRGGQLMTL